MKNIIKALIFSLFAINTFAQQATEIDSKSVKPPRFANLAAIHAEVPVAQQGVMVYNFNPTCSLDLLYTQAQVGFYNLFA